MTVGNTLVIVGAGPVGMVSALLLKDHFDRVVLLERQSRERFLRTRGFTFPIVLSPAAIEVLERVGVWDAISAERSPYFGVVIHKRLFGREFTWTAKRAGVYSHWRNHIVASLHQAVAEHDIEVVFDADVEDIDFARNVCREATLGEVPYDLLLGADGIHSLTRRLMAKANPDFPSNEFGSTLLDRWFAYRLPSTGALAERFDGGDGHYALHVHVDNLPQYPDDKFRLITVAMKQPHEEISVVAKYGAELSLDRAREINDVIFAPLVDADVLDREWNDGVGGEYEHVEAPTYRLNSTLLVGDAAHGFEGNGDLINLGISSVGSLADTIAAHRDIPEALAAYDATVGSALRQYSAFALRRSMEKIDFEVAAFEVGALLRLNKHHPSLWGIYEDGFEIQAYMEGYERHRRRIRAAAGVLSGATLLAGLTRRRLRR